MFAEMAGIYIHIPFCRKACHYCNFHFSTSFKTKEEMIGAMVVEIAMQAAYLDGQEIETIYFGGGTPSSLPIEDIKLLLDAIRDVHQIADDAEITLEANPDDIHAESVTQWKEAGINRLSIGIQAFQDDLLAAWNRSHNAEQATTAIAIAQQAGIDNITADLIYGGPGLSDEDWVSNMQRLIDAGIPHISSYALTVESGTALHHQIEKGKSMIPDDDQANRQYAILQDMLTANGILQYEISNFALPGFESRHNGSYWSGAHYLGIGPSAHSYNGVSRQWNVSNNVRYIQSIGSGVIPSEMEILTEVQRFNELVMTGLRTSKGIDMKGC
ncbi:MAG: radical SAM family heme chaperone HemW [Saprospiraceae bacterium]|nr:radical SAM family heme chaperone HemW [Candidatus Opimibacter skivensis]